MTEENQNESTTKSEEFEIAASQVADKLQQLIHEGNIRRLIVRTQGGRVLLDTSLTVGAGVGGALALFTSIPLLPLAGIAALAGAFARVKVEIVRELQDGDVLEDPEDKRKVEIDVEDE